MSGFLAFPLGIPPYALKSATSQRGGRMGAVVPGAANVGALSMQLAGAPTDVLEVLAQVVDAGDVKTATAKISFDGGTNWKGRKVDTTWDGNGATERTVLVDTGSTYPSRPVLIDTDGDGILDRALCAVHRASPSPDQIAILYTDDLTGAGAWSTLTASAYTATTVTPGSPVLLNVGDDLFLFFRLNVGGLVVIKSADSGVTWGSAVTVDANAATDADAILTASGKMLVTYAKDNAGYSHVYCKSSADGVTWTATAKQVTAAGSVDYLNPTVIQEADGKTIVFFYRQTATAGIQARQTTAADPAAGTWAAYSETLWSADSNDNTPSAAIAPDGTIYVAFTDGTSSSLQFSKFKDGDANYSAATSLYNPSNNLSGAKLASIGGALWCLTHDSTAQDTVMVLTRYWTTYDASTAPASWTGTSWQFIGSGAWITFAGVDAEAGDTFAGNAIFDYGAHRVLCLKPAQPAMSIADGSDWNAVFDLGGIGRPFPMDTLLALANLEKLKVQLNATDSWGSPSVTKELSFVLETVASGSRTISGFTVTRTSGSWQPRELLGLEAKLGSGVPFLIVDNTADTIYADRDLGSDSGDLKILSGRAWDTITLANYAFMRVLVESQETRSGRYEVGAVACARRSSLTYLQRSASFTVASPVVDSKDAGGAVQRYSSGGVPLREGVLSLLAPTEAQYRELLPQVKALGVYPFCYVPDDTLKTDWILAYPSGTIRWSARQTDIPWTEAR